MRFSARDATRAAALVSVLALTAAVPACSCDAGGENGATSTTSSSAGGGDGPTGSGGGGTGGDLTSQAVGGGLTSGTTTPDDPIASIAIEPPEATVVVVDGVAPDPLQFTAIATHESGETSELTDGEWSFDRIDIGGIVPASGAFEATGNAGGVGTVTLEAGELEATATVTVRLEYALDPGNVPQNVKDAFDDATVADPTVTTILYPYDRTVFPRGLAGPVIQWNGGGPSDIYRIRATSDTFSMTTWVGAPPPSRYAFPQSPDDIWKKLTDSTTGDVVVEVQRYDGTQAYLPLTRTWSIAPAVLTGTVYYWEVNNGNVVRLKPGDTAPEDFLERPVDENGVPRCVACHSAAKQGNRLVAHFDGSASPWGVWDAEEGDALYDSATPTGFSAISPDGEYVLWGQSQQAAFGQPPTVTAMTLSRFDAAASLGTLDPPGDGLPVHPAWSTDGGSIAFGVRTDGNWLDFTSSTLWIAGVDVASGQFTDPRQIVANDVGGLTTVTFPTFSPDSQKIAFMRANQARTREALGEIHMANADGTDALALAQLNGAGYLQGVQAQATYEPTFLPVAVGGYNWLIVVSERTYGNTLTDETPATRRKQLWVSAIDVNAPAGQDPSHPAFWLPGQGLDNQNMRGEWVLSPCKALGDECSAGYECCEGYCTQQPDGTKVCSEGGGGCSQAGEACETAADCCDETLECIGGFCAEEQPPDPPQ
jgi:hypothetical protein